MNGQPPPEKPILIAPKEVEVRESSDILAIPHLPTSKALKYIWDNYRDINLSVDEIVKISGISRRRLEDHFNKYIGHSMPKELLRLRFEEAKKLLQESDLKIFEVADQSGFSSPKYMAKIFRQQLGGFPKNLPEKKYSLIKLFKAANESI